MKRAAILQAVAASSSPVTSGDCGLRARDDEQARELTRLAQDYTRKGELNQWRAELNQRFDRVDTKQDKGPNGR